MHPQQVFKEMVNDDGKVCSVMQPGELCTHPPHSTTVVLLCKKH